MASQRELLERARREARILAELSALAGTDCEYSETIHTTLRLIEQVVSCPLLCLSIQESNEVRHYARADDDIDPMWADGASRSLAATQERRLLEGPTEAYTISGPAASFRAFPATTRSGRSGALALGSPHSLGIALDEEHLMLRLATQVVLVLDHALLLGQLREQETTDRMTGVASHRRLLDMLDYELGQHAYTGKCLALMLVDVEGLDGINRSYGHHYGNHILRQLARMVQETVRPVDLVARCGNHDFAVMLTETTAEGGQEISHAVRERFMMMEFAGGTMGLSVGVAHARPDEALSPESLLRRAEGALREAKRQRRTLSIITLPAGIRGRPAVR